MKKILLQKISTQYTQYFENIRHLFLIVLKKIIKHNNTSSSRTSPLRIFSQIGFKSCETIKICNILFTLLKNVATKLFIRNKKKCRIDMSIDNISIYYRNYQHHYLHYNYTITLLHYNITTLFHYYIITLHYMTNKKTETGYNTHVSYHGLI